MKKYSMFLLIAMFLIGCGPEDVIDPESETSFIVKKRVGDVPNEEYIYVKTIENKEDVNTITSILNGAKWATNVDVDMDPPDFRLNDFDIWVTPNRDYLQVDPRSKSYFVGLNSSNSQTLYEIITGEKLE